MIRMRCSYLLLTGSLRCLQNWLEMGFPPPTADIRHLFHANFRQFNICDTSASPIERSQTLLIPLEGTRKEYTRYIETNRLSRVHLPFLCRKSARPSDPSILTYSKVGSLLLFMSFKFNEDQPVSPSASLRLPPPPTLLKTLSFSGPIGE